MDVSVVPYEVPAGSELGKECCYCGSGVALVKGEGLAPLCWCRESRALARRKTEVKKLRQNNTVLGQECPSCGKNFALTAELAWEPVCCCREAGALQDRKRSVKQLTRNQSLVPLTAQCSLAIVLPHQRPLFPFTTPYSDVCPSLACAVGRAVAIGNVKRYDPGSRRVWTMARDDAGETVFQEKVLGQTCLAKAVGDQEPLSKFLRRVAAAPAQPKRKPKKRSGVHRPGAKRVSGRYPRGAVRKSGARKRLTASQDSD